MPAPTTQILGADYLYKFGGTTLGGRRGGTINLTSTPIDVTTADSSQWRELIDNIREWSVDLDGLYVEGATPAAIGGAGATFGVWDPSLNAGAGGYHDLKGLRTITVSMSMDTTDITTQDDAKARSIKPTIRSVSISVDADWIDPAGTGAEGLDALVSDWENGDFAQVKVAWGGEGSSIVFDTALVTNIAPGHPHDSHVPVSITLEASGEPTDTFTNPDAGLEALLTSFFAATPSTVAGIFETGTSGATSFSGDVYPTSLELTIPHDDAVSVSGTATGTGGITRGTTA